MAAVNLAVLVAVLAVIAALCAYGAIRLHAAPARRGGADDGTPAVKRGPGR